VIDKDSCTARIKDISSQSVVTVEFNTPMKTEGLNLTHINSTMADLYIQPYLDWHLSEPNFSLSLLNFTWNVTEF